MENIANPAADPMTLIGGMPLSHGTAEGAASQSELTSFVPITFIPRDESESFVVPASAHALDGFREWALSESFPERGKITFVAGELIFDMSPESVEEHSEVKTEFSRVLAALVRERKLGRLHIDGVLITNKAAGVSNEPDALFLSKETLKSGRLIFTPEKGRPQSSKEIVGTVDWVLEIVSPSSRRKDTELLREAYFKAGIPEYWLANALGEDVDLQILVAGKDGYVAVDPRNDWLASPTFGCSFLLTRERDDDGFWQYTLHVQEKP